MKQIDTDGFVEAFILVYYRSGLQLCQNTYETNQRDPHANT